MAIPNTAVFTQGRQPAMHEHVVGVPDATLPHNSMPK